MILMDIRTSDLTLGEVMTSVEAWSRQYPDHEIYMDGDIYAIVAVPREVTA